MTSWRTLAFGEAISYDPESDTLLSVGPLGEYVADAGGDHVFVALPFQDAREYTDLNQLSLDPLYAGLYRVVANDGSVFPDLALGSWFAAQLIVGSDDHSDAQILTDFSYSYAGLPAQLAPLGVTLVPDALGVLFSASKDPFTVEDLTPPHPVVPVAWRTLALGQEFDYDSSADLSLDQVPGSVTYYPGGTETAFVALPLVEGHHYTDFSGGSVGYAGLVEILSSDGSVLPSNSAGQVLLIQLQNGINTPLDFTSYNASVAQLGSMGIELAQRAVGLQWTMSVSPGPYTIEDLDAAPVDPEPDPDPDPIDVQVSKFIPPGFNSAEIIAGLHTAMSFGMPTRTEDRATFYLPRTSVDAAAAMDLHNVPFNPTVRRTVSTNRVQVSCAVEFYAGGQVIEQFGSVAADKILLTLLDTEYQQVKDFLYVVAGGDKYLRSITQPPMALGSIDVWQVWADSENER